MALTPRQERRRRELLRQIASHEDDVRRIRSTSRQELAGFYDDADLGLGGYSVWERREMEVAGVEGRIREAEAKLGDSGAEAAQAFRSRGPSGC